jgi:hypothetical protein
MFEADPGRVTRLNDTLRKSQSLKGNWKRAEWMARIEPGDC